MASCLQDLPVELTETIVLCLDLPSICALRGTCRSLAAKASHGHFRSHLRVKTISLTTQSLQKARDFLQSTTLSRFLQSLSVIGITGSLNSTRSIGDQAEVARQLSCAFTSVKAALKNGRLLSLRLDVLEGPVDQSLEWEQRQKGCFDTGIATVQATVVALQQSGLSIERLDMFSMLNRPSETNPRRHFSLPISHVCLWTQAQEVRECLRDVKQLSLSLSYHLPLDGGEDTAIAYDPAMGTRNISALAEFFRMMPFVEELDLHWSNGSRYGARSDVEKQEGRFFNTCHTAIPSKRLQKLALRGLRVDATALVSFINESSARNITLQHIRIYGDCCKPLLNTLSRSEDSFNYLHLDDLFECHNSNGLVHYRGPGEPKFPYLRGVDGPSEIIREGSEVQKELERTFGRSRPVGSPAYSRWRRNNTMDFGYA